MTQVLALDTSVAVPLLVREHDAHARVTAWWAGREVHLAGHALVETYAVLTRLPGDIRVAPPDAARLIASRFAPPLGIGPETLASLPDLLAGLEVAGGAVYDALVALAAREHGARLGTRDGRATGVYERVGVRVEIVS